MSDSDDINLLYATAGQESIQFQGKGLMSDGTKNEEPSENRRLKKTLALCGAFFGLGLAIAVLGPTLQNLQVQLHADLPHVSYIFTGRSAGYVLGSILGGIVFERFHPLMLIAITLGMSGIGLLATPYCQQLFLSVITISFVGAAMGVLDTGANVVCLRMWGKKSSPFMQALHFSFALGAFIAPLLAGPFIGNPGPSVESRNILSIHNDGGSLAPINNQNTFAAEVKQHQKRMANAMADNPKFEDKFANQEIDAQLTRSKRNALSVEDILLSQENQDQDQESRLNWRSRRVLADMAKTRVERKVDDMDRFHAEEDESIKRRKKSHFHSRIMLSIDDDREKEMMDTISDGEDVEATVSPWEELITDITTDIIWETTNDLYTYTTEIGGATKAITVKGSETKPTAAMSSDMITTTVKSSDINSTAATSSDMITTTVKSSGTNPTAAMSSDMITTPVKSSDTNPTAATSSDMITTTVKSSDTKSATAMSNTNKSMKELAHPAATPTTSSTEFVATTLNKTAEDKSTSAPEGDMSTTNYEDFVTTDSPWLGNSDSSYLSQYGDRDSADYEDFVTTDSPWPGNSDSSYLSQYGDKDSADYEDFVTTDSPWPGNSDSSYLSQYGDKDSADYEDFVTTDGPWPGNSDSSYLSQYGNSDSADYEDFVTTDSPWPGNSDSSYNKATTDSPISDSSKKDDSYKTNTTHQQDNTPTKSHFQGVYVIIAIFLMLMALVFAYFFCTSPLHTTGQYKDSQGEMSTKPSDNNFTQYIMTLLCVFYFLYVGAEVGYGGFIYTFATTHPTVHLTVSEATHLNALFWGTFALGRGLSICIASWVSPLHMLIVDLVGCFISSMALAIAADSSSMVLWFATAILGLSMASLFPAGISWLESHAPVTGSMASILIVGAAFGEMVIPLLLGKLFSLESVGPMSLMYLMCIISILTAAIFGTTVFLAGKEGRNYDPLPKEDALEDILTGVQSAIDPDDSPHNPKQKGKSLLPKALQVKKHKI